MNKTAQQRNLWNKFVENVGDVSGIAAEQYFDPDLKSIMQDIRTVDDSIRATVSGKIIDNQSPEGEFISLKELLKSAKSNFNRREYFRAISDLSKFHEKTKLIASKVQTFNVDVSNINKKFLFENLDDSYISNILGLKERFEPKTSSSLQSTLVKKAGILDMLHNLFSERGRALSFWERRHPTEVRKLKTSVSALLNNSESFFQRILANLKGMARARSVRDVDTYIKLINNLEKDYLSYHKQFEKFYLENVKEVLDTEEIFKSITVPTDLEEESLGEPISDVSDDTKPVVDLEPSTEKDTVFEEESEETKPLEEKKVAPVFEAELDVPAPMPDAPPVAPPAAQTETQDIVTDYAQDLQKSRAMIDSAFNKAQEGMSQENLEMVNQALSEAKEAEQLARRINADAIKELKRSEVGKAASLIGYIMRRKIYITEIATNLSAKQTEKAEPEQPEQMESAAYSIALSMSKESPLIVASVLKKYASNIKNINPKEANNAIRIIKKIQNYLNSKY